MESILELLIKNGTVVDPSQRLYAQRDLLISNGKIKKIIPPHTHKYPVDHTIDAKGLIVCPGWIDMHTHLREPGQEHKETIASGSQAAARGGFTTIVVMANTDPVNDNAYITQFIRMKAQTDSRVHILPVGALSKGLKGEELAEIGSLKDAGCVAISDDGHPVMNSYLMRKALDYCKQFDLPIISHAEDSHLVGQAVMHEGLHSMTLGLRGNPSAAEEIMVARDIALADLTSAHVHFAHISTQGALRLIRDAKKRRVRISAEVTPHHLFLTDSAVAHYDPNFKMSPPLRTETDLKALRMGLKQNVIDAFATDHAPHSTLEKDLEFENAANGVIGLETALPITLKLVHDKTLTLPQFISKWTLGPAKILKLNKGTLKVGQDADITIFDPDKPIRIDKEEFESKSRNTPFHGWKCHGKIHYTIVGGKIVYQA